MLYMYHTSHDKDKVKTSKDRFSDIIIIYSDIPKITIDKIIKDDLKVNTVKFDSMTFQKLKVSGFSETINPFFDTLELEEQSALFTYFVDMKQGLSELTKANIQQKIMEFSNNTSKLFNNLNLPERILTYTKTHGFPFPDLSDAGTRAHDTEAMTFRLPDYIVITAICILCKIMTPVWGELFVKLKTTGDHALTGTENRELYCAEILEGLLERCIFTPVYNRLLTYIYVATDSKLKYNVESNNTKFVLSRMGISLDRFKDMMVAMILVKKMATYNILVNVNNPLETPNLMRNINAAVKETTEGKVKHWHSETTIMPRWELQENMSDDEDNTSVLDHTSRLSTKTADFPIIATIGIETSTSRYIKELNIPRSVFDEACDYYQFKNVNINVYNKALIASVLVTRIGGSSVLLNYINIKEYISLLVITQILLLRSKPAILSLAYLLTSNDTLTDTDSVEYTSLKNRLTSFKNSHQTFKVCRDLFPSSVYQLQPIYQNDIPTAKSKLKMISHKFETQVSILLNWMLSHEHKVVMAPSLVEYFNLEKEIVSNGNIVKIEYNHAIDLCNFFTELHSSTLT